MIIAPFLIQSRLRDFDHCPSASTDLFNENLVRA
jgi:hypothetical protein